MSKTEKTKKVKVKNFIGTLEDTPIILEIETPEDTIEIKIRRKKREKREKLES